MPYKPIEKIQGKNRIKRNLSEIIIGVFPILATPTIPFLLRVEQSQLTQSLIATVVLGIGFSLYLFSSNQRTLKIAKEGIWLVGINPILTQVDLIKQNDVHSIVLNDKKDHYSVLVSYVEEGQDKTFELFMKEKGEFEEIKKRLSSQSPIFSNKMSIQA